MSPLPLNVILTPAQPVDFSSIARIAKLSFINDTNTQLKTLVNGKEVFLEEDYVPYLSSLHVNPRIDIIVAKELPAPTPASKSQQTASGTVVGAVIWGKRNYDIPLLETAPQPADNAWNPSPAAPTIPPHRPLKVADLEALTNASNSTWQAHLCPDKVRCRFIIGLIVHPDHQGRGIGGALIRWGTEACDADGIYCWVQSSMGARGAYESAGFRELGRLELDLDVFAEGRRRPGDFGDGDVGGEWGVYVWPYMIRNPKTRMG